MPTIRTKRTGKKIHFSGKQSNSAINLLTSAPIEAWKCNLPPFQIIMTVRPNQPTEMRVPKEIILPTMYKNSDPTAIRKSIWFRPLWGLKWRPQLGAIKRQVCKMRDGKLICGECGKVVLEMSLHLKGNAKLLLL